ncbi:MAG: YggS family pyridoxal phosphate-dependent enzyme [Proteobacteria bacterium]|nr:YggS family pyridoxal phosphate-dependent enzyme [Pseudomonadota bacterium]
MTAPHSPVSALAQIKEALCDAAVRHGRVHYVPPGIVAVSKTHPAERIEPLLKAGHRLFGENRVQEAEAKWPDLKARYPGVELHLIGPLQTNKTADALALFDVIETLDRPKLADQLAKELAKTPKKDLKLFVQVNTGEEEQKAGVGPKEADGFIRYCREKNLPVVGLMCIPPVAEDPAPHFALLRTIAERNGLTALSMGMSGDFGIAAALGATHVRIGSALFGERAKP